MVLKKVKRYLKKMVFTRNGSMVHPCIKEAVVNNNNNSPNRHISRRIAELPSLRYGTVGAKSLASGPLRVSNNNRYETLPRTSSRKSNGKSYAEDDMAYKPVRPPRRVRFNLPDGDASINDAYGKGVVQKSTAGDGWMRTTRAPISSNGSSSNTSDEQVQHHQTDVQYIFPHVQRANRHNNNNNNNIAKEIRQTVPVSVTVSPGVRTRIHPTGRYIRGTLSPTANTTAPAAQKPGSQVLLRTARDGDDNLLRDLLRRSIIIGISENDLNATDSSGRTLLSYVASNGTLDILEQILSLSGLDPNKPDNEGNTPLHFAAQAGQVECLNCMLSRCRNIEIDARNNLGFTPLMKAALQGRNKCAKMLLFAGANPTLRDNGRGLRADQWARFCGRYICADVIEKHARQRLLERSTSYGNWGSENEMGARILLGKVMPVPQINPQTSHGIKSKLRKVFRTSSGPGHTNDNMSSARLVTQLTSAALCASSPVLPSAPTVPPVVKSLIRPLTVPRLQITLVNNNGELNNTTNVTNGINKTQVNTNDEKEKPSIVKPARTKKKK